MNLLFQVYIRPKIDAESEAAFSKTIEWPDAWRLPNVGDMVDPSPTNQADIDLCEVFAVYLSPARAEVEVHLAMVTSMIDRHSAILLANDYKAIGF